MHQALAPKPDAEKASIDELIERSHRVLRAVNPNYGNARIMKR